MDEGSDMEEQVRQMLCAYQVGAIIKTNKQVTTSSLGGDLAWISECALNIADELGKE